MSDAESIASGAVLLPPAPDVLLATLGQNWTLVIDADPWSVQTPVSLSSMTFREDDQGEPQLDAPIAVFRGSNEWGGAAVIAENGRLRAIVNGPWGDTLKIDLPQRRGENALHGEVPADPLFGQPVEATALHAIPSGDALKLGDVPHFGSGIRAIDAVHFSPPGGHSIATTKHLHLPDELHPVDPVNVIFYHQVTLANVQTVLAGSGWTGGVCGNIERLWIFDVQHGGQDAWWNPTDQWASRAGCIVARDHIRLYPSLVGDTHPFPNFQSYLVGPVHYETVGLCGGIPCHTNVNPHDGQDHLLADISDHPLVQNERFVQVPNSAAQCDSCGRWQGWVDFYEITSIPRFDPCNENSNPTYQIWTGSGSMKIRWTCHG